MKKWIFSMALVVISFPSFDAQKMVSQDFVKVPEVMGPMDIDYLSPDSFPSEKLAVKPIKTDGFSGSNLIKLQAAFEIINRIVNSVEFKDRIINFKNKNGKREFASNKGLSNEEIYQIFMDGREILLPDTPGEMNLYLKLYHNRFSRVIGYTSPKTNLIHINFKYFKNYSPQDVASNLVHEWVHKLGFDHKSAKEHDSVPYAIGYIVDDIYLKMAKRELH